MADPTPTPDPHVEDSSGTLRRAVLAARGRSTEVRNRVDGFVDRIGIERERWPMLDMGLDAYERDRSIGGGLLGGALAFRLFLVALPAMLVGVAALGFASDVDPSAPAETARRMGLAESTARSLATSAQLAEDGRWWTMAVGLVALLLALRILIKSLRVVEALAWHLELPRMRGVVARLAAAVLLMAMVCALLAVAAWLRDRTPGGGVALAMVMMVIWLVPWTVIQALLPRDERASWTSVLPGSVVLAIGTQALHAATVFYFAGRVGKMSETYGPLGLAAVVLLWLYVVGRLFVAAAVLNATVWERSTRGLDSYPRAVAAVVQRLERLPVVRRGD